MKKKFSKKSMLIVGVISAVVLSVAYSGNDDASEKNEIESKTGKTIKNEVKICDGTSVTEDCELDGIQYSVYKYYPAIEEKSHIETITTYKKEVSGYCTLCKDGTYSPTCATGKGACSHHGGVAQWNAPRYRDVPVYEEKKIIDSPAIPERYEKIIKD